MTIPDDKAERGGLAGDSFDDLMQACDRLAKGAGLDQVLERHEAVLRRTGGDQ
ncbi:hypothetical protein [Allostella humosa]|uniref:hypothetical protein n=1 Tax=Stella humosa TaxID=94 RepID=UPI001476E9E0|nr:hypothetical protein [Stella humosa]